MALKGRLRDFSLTQLLNLIHLARKTGGLAIEEASNRAELYFQEGKLIYASLQQQPNRLGDVLVRAGKLSSSQLNSVMASGHARDDNQLGRMLLQTHQVTRDDIINTLQQEMRRAIATVMQWRDGSFIFDQKQGAPAGRVTIPMSLEGMIAQASQKREELTIHQNELPNLDVVLKFTEGTNLRNVNLSVDEWRFISYVNQRFTVATIQQYTQMSEYQVREIVSRLMRDGLVELADSRSARGPLGKAVPPPPAAPSRPAQSGVATKAGAVPAGDSPRPSFSKPAVEKGLLNRIISRIRGL